MTTAAEVLLSERHRDRLNRIIAQASQATGRAWNSLGDITNPSVVDRWLSLWGQVDSAAARAAIAATDGYFGLATDLSALGLEPVDPWDLRGVSAEDYLMRPIITARARLGDGMDWQQAILVGLDRALSMTATDVQLAQRHAADGWAKSGRIAGYRRTLTGASCALCATASTQRYHSDHLEPIHGKCDCGVAPIKGDNDPGQVINQRLLNRLKDEGGPAVWDRPYGIDEHGHLRLRRTETVRDPNGDPVINPETGKPRTRMALGDKVAAQVHQHGELGPVLTAPGDTFSKP